MTWYFFTQHGKSSWKPSLADDRERILSEEQPDFCTVLDLNRIWETGEERPRDVAYRGPFYLDWDGDVIQDVLDSVKRFMNKLESHGFDLNQASWFLSGKKGIHCTIPMECFTADSDLRKLKASGHPALPTVYRMLASDESLITPHMDLSIYSQGKGRMWRVVNRPRTLDDGRTTFKVQIPPEQLRKLDEQGYWDWCSQQRPAAYVAPPTRNQYLAVEFSRALRDTTNNLKHHKANVSKRVDFSAWTEIPPTIAAAFRGEGLLQKLDLNVLKLQLAIAAVAVGFDDFDKEDAFIQAVDGFIESRVGTSGAAHQTRESIERAMRDCFRSVVKNPCYVYYPNVFATILTTEAGKSMDLQGRQTSVTDKEARRKRDDADLRDEVVVDEMGPVEVGKDNYRAIGNYSWKPGSLMKILDDNGEIQSYSVIPLVQGEEKPRQVLPIEVTQKLDKMQERIMRLGGHLEAVGSRKYSQVLYAWKQFVGENLQESSEALAVVTEGIYAQVRHDPEEHGVKDSLNLFWLSPTKCIQSLRNFGTNIEGQYLAAPLYVEPANSAGRYNVDISDTPYTMADAKTNLSPTVDALLNLNGNIFSLAALLGWFTACSVKHPLYCMGLIKNFPILQVYGEAGCGKTTTMNLLLHLFTWKKPFQLKSAGSGLSEFALKALATGTTSIPLVVDEVKAQNLGKGGWLEMFRQTLQTQYTIGGEGLKGGGKAIGSHHNELVKSISYAPVAFLGETLETSQTSLMERIIPVGFHVADKYGRWGYAKHLQHNSREISIVGWTIIKAVLECDLEALAELYRKSSEDANLAVYSGSNDRIFENCAMVLTGFRFFSNVIREHLPGKFDEKLESMETALLDRSNWRQRVDSEVVRLLNFIAQASHADDYDRTRAIPRQHYEFQTGEHPTGMVDYLILDVDRVYYLYRERIKNIGETPIYSSEEEMYQALRNSNLAVDSFSHPDMGPRCVKFDPVKMGEQGIRKFKRT